MNFMHLKYNESNLIKFNKNKVNEFATDCKLNCKIIDSVIYLLR